MEQKKNYTLPIIMMFGLFAMISFVTGLTNPLAVIVKEQFDAPNWMSQLGNAANFIAYAFMGLPAGLMLKKIGYKKTALTAIAVGFIGVTVQFMSGEVESFYIYLAGAFISGFSMCMLNTVVNPMLNTLGGGGRKGNQLIQFGGSLNSIAATIVPIFVGYLMGGAAKRALTSAPDTATAVVESTAVVADSTAVVVDTAAAVVADSTIIEAATAVVADSTIIEAATAVVTNAATAITDTAVAVINTVPSLTISDAAPAIFIAMGVFALAFTVLYVMNIPEPFAINEKKSAIKEKFSALSFRHFVLGAVAIFVYVGVEVGIPNFINLFLTTAKDASGYGMATAMAGSIVGTYWFLMMIGRLVGGVLGAKFTSRAQLAFVSSLAVIFVIIGIFSPIDTTVSMPVFTGTGFAFVEAPISVMFFVLCGLCTSVMWGGIFNLAVEGIGKYTSMGSGIFMVMVCGGGILPLIQGVVADNATFMASYWVVVAGLAYMLYYALFGSKNVNKDIPVE